MFGIWVLFDDLNHYHLLSQGVNVSSASLYLFGLNLERHGLSRSGVCRTTLPEERGDLHISARAGQTHAHSFGEC